MNKYLTILLLLIASVSRGAAQQTTDLQTSRPITSEYRLEAGGGYIHDAYLSPLKYTGFMMNLAGCWSKRMPFAPEHAGMWFDGEVNCALPKNPARNSSLIDLGGAFDWGMAYHFSPAPQWSVAAGASVGLNGSIDYLPPNSNNVVSVHLWTGLSLCGEAGWQTHLGRYPLRVFDRLSLPSLGAFYCPEFGETYYEIYLGNRHGLVHCGWWGNHFAIDNLLGATLRVGRRELLVGYRLKIDSSWANALNYQRAGHFLVIGFTK